MPAIPSRDFDDESAYLRFVRAVVDAARNAAAATRLAEERPYLRPLPSARIPEYTTFQCVVRKWSTIRVGGRIYSVPSRLGFGADFGSADCFR